MEKTITKSINSHLPHLLITAFAVILVHSIYLSKYNFDPGVLIGISKNKAECLPDFPKNVPYLPNTQGFDSADYFAVAKDPLLRLDYSKCNWDNIAYNTQRYFYHALAWFFSFNRNNWVKYSYLFINVLILTLTSFVWARILNLFNIPKIFAPLFVLNVGVWYAFRFNTADNLVFLLGSYSFYLFEKKKIIPLIFILSLGMLTRNVFVGFCATYFFLTILKEKNILKALCFFLPVLPYKFILLPWISSRFEAEISIGETFLVLPFQRIFETISAGYHNYPIIRAFLDLSAGLLIFFMILLCLYHFLKYRKLDQSLLLVFGYSSILAIYGNTGWGNGPLHTIRIIIIAVPLTMLILKRYQYPKIFFWLISLYSIVGPAWLLFSPSLDYRYFN